MESEKKSAQEIIRSIITALGTNPRAFALHMNQSYAKIYDICRGKTKVITLDVMEAMVNYYNVNRNYILQGEGEMFVPQQPEITRSDDPITENFLNIISRYSNQVAELNRRIHQLETENENLRNRPLTTDLLSAKGNDIA